MTMFCYFPLSDREKKAKMEIDPWILLVVDGYKFELHRHH